MAFTDDFTGTNGQLLENRSGWSLVINGAYTAKIYSNAICSDARGEGAGPSVWQCTDQGSADQYVQATVNFTVASDFLCTRLIDRTNFLGWYLGGTGAAGSRFVTYASGILTTIVSTQGADTNIIKITCEGNTVKYYKDGVQQGGDQTITDGNAETSQGFVFEVDSGDVTKFYDFEAGPMAADKSLAVGKVIMVM